MMHIVVADIVEMRHTDAPTSMVESCHQRSCAKEHLSTNNVAGYNCDHKQVQVNTHCHLEWVHVDPIHDSSGRGLLLMVMLVNVRVDRSQMKSSMKCVVEEIVQRELQQGAHQRIPYCELTRAPGHRWRTVQISEEVVEEASSDHTVDTDIPEVLRV